MAETGVIGYSEMDFKKIRLIWSDFLIQNYENSLCLTDLSYKPFPLIKYFPDDYLGNEDEKICETIYTLENLIENKEKHLNLYLIQKISLFINCPRSYI